MKKILSNRLEVYVYFLGLIGCLFLNNACAVLKPNLPALPENVDVIIEKAEEMPLPNFYLGKAGKVEMEDAEIWYESIGDPTDPTILLVMGFATSGLAWSPDLIQPLVEEGYHVIRYDNKDVGRSTWIADWKAKSAYNLSDMALDGMKILDHLGIEKAHIVGVSMGGMIGQVMALKHSKRVASLTSIMSTGHFFDKELTSLSKETLGANIALGLIYGRAPKKTKKAIKKHARTLTYLRKHDTVSEEMIQTITTMNRFYEKEGIENHPKVDRHHSKAIRSSGSRLEALKTLDLPVLVIHGKQDPLILPEHGLKCAEIIPNSEFLMIDDMGHIPESSHYEVMSSAITHFIDKQNTNLTNKD